MVKASKRALDPTAEDDPSASRSIPKRAKTKPLCQTETTGKTRGHSKCKRSGKVRRTTRKLNKIQPRIRKRKAAAKTTTAPNKSQRAKGSARVGQNHLLMEDMSAKEKEPDHIFEISSMSSSDPESE